MKKAQLINFPNYAEENGSLIVYESGQTVPYVSVRIFIVKAGKGDIRGEHSHKKCSQLLICTSGSVNVSIMNGIGQEEFILNQPEKGLLIPPGNWAVQKYLADNTVLMVLCDRKYEEDDYIRNFQDFIVWKSTEK